MKTYNIYQLKDNDELNQYLFTGMDLLKRFGLEVKKENYELVYTGQIEESGCELDDIYEELNINRPEDYKGHSLSTSDIVEIDGKFFFCDSYGWVEVFTQPSEAEAEADPYEGLKYNVTKINRNFRIKVAGLVEGVKVNTLVGVSGLMEIVQDIALTNRLLDRAFQSVDDKCVCKLRRGVKITFYVA